MTPLHHNITCLRALHPVSLQLLTNQLADVGGRPTECEMVTALGAIRPSDLIGRRCGDGAGDGGVAMS